MLALGRGKHYLPLKALSLYAFILFYCFEGVCGDCAVPRGTAARLGLFF